MEEAVLALAFALALARTPGLSGPKGVLLGQLGELVDVPGSSPLWLFNFVVL